MKITIVIILLVVVLLASNVTSIAYNGIADNINSKVDSAYNTALTDTDASKTMLMDAYEYYKQNELFMAATLNHEEMHQVEELFLDAKGYIECKDIPRFLSELYKIKKKMEHLKKMESFTLNDIF